ncbi:MAG: hypothetical protein NC299_12435 [Lachnospiraceae bacterium]|nr:hypothetical protein [Ruminococcus sp.]MCM1276149.1 hypothetical protein [Lachnospiraceae bacterium]
MATFSFDRPLVLDEEATEKFLEIALTPAKPDGIKPFSLEEQRESEEIIKKWYENQRNKK